MKSPVTTKSDFVLRYANGEFGNKGWTWHTLKEVMDSKYRGMLHIRSRNPGGQTFYNVFLEEIPKVIQTENLDPEEFYYSAMAPHQHGTIQGNVLESSRGLILDWVPAKLPMRDAITKEGGMYTSRGIIALELLRRHLNPMSFAWMGTLLSEYPEHVIEFSAFTVRWGDLRGHNTCFWEVRNY